MIKNSLTYILTVLLATFSVYILADKVLVPQLLYVDEISIPNVVGHDISTAKILLDNKELKIHVTEIPSNKNDIIGRVEKVEDVGKIVKIGTTIYLKILGERENYIVPDLTLKSKNIGISMLKSMKIKIDTIFYDYWNTICTDPSNIILDNSFNDIMDNCIKYNKNIIWKQLPKPNERIFKDEGITLYISNGQFTPELYIVPDLIGLNLNQAIELINKSGLLLGNIDYVSGSVSSKDKVIDQSLIGPSRIVDKINLTVIE